jgi:hypothetical protein
MECSKSHANSSVRTILAEALCFVRAGFQPGEGVGDGGAVGWEGGSWRKGGGGVAGGASLAMGAGGAIIFAAL